MNSPRSDPHFSYAALPWSFLVCFRFPLKTRKLAVRLFYARRAISKCPACASAKATDPLSHKLAYFTKDGASLDAASFTAAANATVSANFAERTAYSVKTVTNDSELGTVSVDPNVAEVGETVTVTLTRASTGADLKSLKIYMTGDTTTTVTPSGSGLSYTFTMPAYNVTVYSEWEVHSDTANFWYDGYQRKGTDDDADKLVKQDGTGTTQDLDNLQFSEAMYNGNEYAYLKVTRADTDPNTSANYQEFVVKSGENAVNAGSAGNYFYVAIESNNAVWTNNVKTRFYVNNAWQSYDGMQTFSPASGHTVTNGSYWRIYVPSGATKAQVQSNTPDGASNPQYTSGEWTLSNGGSIKLDSSASSMQSWDSGKSDVYGGGGGGTGATDGNIWYRNGGTDEKLNKAYEYITSADDKYHNMALGTFSHNSHDYPMHSQVVSPQSYYVVILYPDKDYGSLYEGQATVSTSTKYRVYVSKILPGQVDPTVTYYAKDGVVRTYCLTTAKFATTTVTPSAAICL